VIRRGFWFAAGAVAGIAGYRRAARAAKTLLPYADLLAPTGRRVAAGRVPARALGAGAGQQSEDSQGRSGPQTSQERPLAGQTLTAGTAAFVRDVRIGMADYLDGRRGI
jgi:hypothetical protein